MWGINIKIINLEYCAYVIVSILFLYLETIKLKKYFSFNSNLLVDTGT